MALADAEAAAYALAALGEHHLRPPPRVLHDTDIADPHSVREARAHRLHDRLLGREAHREETLAPLGLGELRQLLGHQQVVDEARAEALQSLPDAPRLEHIDANAEDHARAASIKAFISRTAAPSPSNSAREMMA